MDMPTFTPMVAEINRGANVTGGTIYGTCLLGKSVVGAHSFFYFTRNSIRSFK